MYRTRLTLNADHEKLALNKTGKGSKGDVLRDVRKRVEEVTTKPRSNAVLALEFLLSASPEWFEGKSNAEKINEWANESTDINKVPDKLVEAPAPLDIPET